MRAGRMGQLDALFGALIEPVKCLKSSDVRCRRLSEDHWKIEGSGPAWRMVDESWT